MYENKITLKLRTFERDFELSGILKRIQDFVQFDENTKKIIGILGELRIHESPQMNRADIIALFDYFSAIENMTLHKATFNDLPGPNLLKKLQGLTIGKDCAILNYSPVIVHLPLRELHQLKSTNIHAEEKNMTIGAIIELFSTYAQEPPVAVVKMTCLGKVLKALTGKGSAFIKYATVKTRGVTFHINRAERKLKMIVSKQVTDSFNLDYLSFICRENFDEAIALYEDTFEKYVDWNFYLATFPKFEFQQWKRGENGKLTLGMLQEDESQESVPEESDLL